MRTFRSLLRVAVLAGPLAFNSLSAIASETSDAVARNSPMDYAISPEALADAVVVFRPNANVALHHPSPINRPLLGEITKIERGIEAVEQIIHTANSIVRPLQAGVPVRLFLKRYPGPAATYYLIAILPVSLGGQQ